MARTVENLLPDRIVSGGQTGVDRGALDAAITLGIPHGGWCPRGRLAEDGVIPPQYQLRETGTARYFFRTRQNVADSSGTLILCRSLPLQGGTELTYRCAQRLAKPCLIVDLSLDPTQDEAVDQVRCWIRDERLHVLNVAGPRESSTPGIAAQACQFLVNLLGTAR